MAMPRPVLAAIALALCLLCSVAGAAQMLMRGQYTWVNVSAGPASRLVVALNSTGPVGLVIVPAGEMDSFLLGRGAEALYNRSVGSGFYTVAVPQGEYSVVLGATGGVNESFEALAVPDGEGEMVNLTKPFAYALDLPNYTRVNMSLLSFAPVRVSLWSYEATLDSNSSYGSW